MPYDAASAEGKELAEHLMRLHGDMENERANWDSLWEKITEYLFPRAQQFTSRDATQGNLRGERIFDNTPTLALDRYAAAVGAMVTPDTMQWHGLKPADPDLAEDEDVKEWCEHTARILFGARYAPRANFSSQAHECWLMDGSLGTFAMFVDENAGRNLRYRAIHMSEIYIREDHQGLIDGVHRGKFRLRAHQVAKLCNLPDDDPKKWTMPECVKKALEGPKPNPNAEFEFIHCVYPNEQVDERFADWRSMAFASVYLCVNDHCVVNRSGYRTMPYAVGRHTTGPNEIYGRSPAMTVLRDILMLNEMSKNMIRVAQRNVDPPILISEDGALQPFSMAPGSINPGFVTQNGELMAHAMRPEGDLMIGLELIQDRRTAVNDAFWIRLFQVLVDNPDMTATQALLRAQEKGQLLGPTMGRKQSEFLSSVIERELDILSAADVLPPMPDALLDRGGALAIEFKSTLNRLQRVDDAIGLQNTLELLTPWATIDPTVLDVIDPHKAARIIAEAQGAPADALRSVEELDAMAEDRQTEADVQTLIQALPAGAKAARDLSQAQATALNSPPSIPYVQPQNTAPAI